MIVGADMTHAGKGDDPGCPSMTGIVASFGENPNAIPGDYHRYLASARLQSNDTEVSTIKMSSRVTLLKIVNLL